MSNIKLSKLQIVDPKYWSGFTKEEHLAWLGGKSYQYVDNRIEKIYELNYGDDNLVSFINKFPVHEVEEDVPFRWRLAGSDERNIPLIKAALTTSGSQVASTEQAGLNNGIFYIWFPERYFEVTTHIVGENPESYQLRVIEEPVADGTLWRYKVQNWSDDNSSYVPYSELAADTRWKELFGMTEQTLSQRGNGIHHASNFEMENTLSMIRKTYEVPGNLIGSKNPVYAMGAQGADGSKSKMWINKQEWDFFKQFRRDKARLYMYGRSNKMADGTFMHKGESGNTIRAGYGLYQQMEYGNLLYYNTFSLDIISKFAAELSYGKLADDSREFVLSTGERGAQQFHEAAQAKLGSYTWFRSGHNLKDNGSTVDDSQITSYVFVNGIKFHVIKDPMKNDPIINTIKYKDGLASEYSYDIWDIGTTNGMPNIHRVALKNSPEIYKVIPGIRSPFTPGGVGENATPGIASSRVDGYELHKAFWGGIMVRNVKKTGRILPNVFR
jgi:hypothetical protein